MSWVDSPLFSSDGVFYSACSLSIAVQRHSVLQSSIRSTKDASIHSAADGLEVTLIQAQGQAVFLNLESQPVLFPLHEKKGSGEHVHRWRRRDPGPPPAMLREGIRYVFNFGIRDLLQGSGEIGSPEPESSPRSQ